jgi:small subunit ribosomal protein S16
MAVKIRLTRLGRLHRPFYRVVAIDSRCHREGKANEVLGTYDPLLAEKNITVDIERVHAWVREGAIVSHAVTSLLKRAGYQAIPTEVAAKKPAKVAKARVARKARAKKDGKTPTRWSKGADGKAVPASSRAIAKHAKKLKEARKAQQAEALAAHKAAKAAAAPAAEG